MLETLVENQSHFQWSLSRSLQKMMTSSMSETAKAVMLARENRSAWPKMVSKAASLSMNMMLGGREVLTQEKNARPTMVKRDTR